MTPPEARCFLRGCHLQTWRARRRAHVYRRRENGRISSLRKRSNVTSSASAVVPGRAERGWTIGVDRGAQTGAAQPEASRCHGRPA
ncbi:hypothetical protein ISCGN_027705 [Ixodes scapularis]